MTEDTFLLVWHDVNDAMRKNAENRNLLARAEARMGIPEATEEQINAAYPLTPTPLHDTHTISGNSEAIWRLYWELSQKYQVEVYDLAGRRIHAEEGAHAVRGFFY